MPGGHYQQRVTIGVALGNLRRAQGAACARAIFNDYGLPHAGAQPLAHDARHDVGGTAGRKRHDDLDDLVRVVLTGGRCLRPGCGRNKRGDCNKKKAFHGLSPVFNIKTGLGRLNTRAVSYYFDSIIAFVIFLPEACSASR
ncbi:hypothetical protein D9M73_26140 [compost metagenome]